MANIDRATALGNIIKEGKIYRIISTYDPYSDPDWTSIEINNLPIGSKWSSTSKEWKKTINSNNNINDWQLVNLGGGNFTVTPKINISFDGEDTFDLSGFGVSVDDPGNSILFIENRAYKNDIDYTITGGNQLHYNGQLPLKTTDIMYLMYFDSNATTYGHGDTASITSHLDVSTDAPEEGDILKWNSSTHMYEPVSVAALNFPENTGISIQLKDAVNQYNMVTSDGYKADSHNVTHANKVLGMALQAGSVDDIVQVATSGRVVNPSWSWSPGSPIFLVSTGLNVAGDFADAFIQKIGTAVGNGITTDEINLSIGLSVRL